jgi:ubiquinol-cytochrome c reductase cytochrome b subunit
MNVLLNSQVTFYASYLGFNYVNTIGFLLMCLYMIQLLSGLELSLYYNYSLSYYAFDSIQFIMKDVNIGYLIRIFHIIGSSFYMLFL